MFEQSTIVTVAVMIGGFVAQAAYLKGSFGKALESHGKAIDDLEKSVQHKDTCDARWGGLRDRVTRIEGAANGTNRG